jgi:NNP family nitrate/nitrite transporter-like MFS transporter
VSLKSFLEAGHPPTLFAAFLYFDVSFMIWVLLGPLAVQIAADLHLDAAQKGLMVAAPVLAGALLRVAAGLLADRVGPKAAGVLGQAIVIAGLLFVALHGLHSFVEVLGFGAVLGVAGASFAVALPLASRWYPREHQGTALGIAGAGNSGTVLASLFAPAVAARVGWSGALGLAAIPAALTLLVFILLARNSPDRPAPKTVGAYLAVLGRADVWIFMGLYAVTFGGFVGLASSLPTWFHSEYGFTPVTAGVLTAACVFAGSLFRPVGGFLADRFGGGNTLIVTYAVAAGALGLIALAGLPAGAALVALLAGMLSLGMGNGAVFQLAPQRFRNEIGVVTGLVGMAGGVGGFYLASSLGLSKQITGSYSAGLLVFAGLALAALAGLALARQRWRASDVALAAAALSRRPA